MTKPSHPPYTGAHKTVGNLALQAIATAASITATVANARAQIKSQRTKEVLTRLSDAKRRDKNGETK